MNFMPPVALPFISTHRGLGGIAVNGSGTLIAVVAASEHCVYIYSVDETGEESAGAVTAGTPGIHGSSAEQLNRPRFCCFVHRNGVDTLLICDFGNDRIVEVTADGKFLRSLALSVGRRPWGVAYCRTHDVIALSLHWDHTVVMLAYESGAVKRKVTSGHGDGLLYYPNGVVFTENGRYLLVADWGHSRVGKFCAATGAFVSHCGNACREWGIMAN